MVGLSGITIRLSPVKGVHSIDWAAANNAQGAYVVQMTIRNKSGGGSVASTSRCVIFSRLALLR